MANFKISQVLLLTLIATLLFLTPFLPYSIKSLYLFFIMNILIIILGAEAGLLSSFPEPTTEDKNPVILTALKPVDPLDNITAADKRFQTTATKHVIISSEINTQKKVKVIEKFASEKTVGVARINVMVKKCPSSPSLFFIGDEDSRDGEEDECIGDQAAEEEICGLSGQELFAKAEMFIRNFYKQLQMQREESWQTISDL